MDVLCGIWTLRQLQILMLLSLDRFGIFISILNKKIAHCTACLFSIFNLISACSSSLLFSALTCSSFPIASIFHTSSDLAYATTDFNCLFGNKFKIYYPQHCYCADIITNICMTEVNNSDFEHIVNVVLSL